MYVRFVPEKCQQTSLMMQVDPRMRGGFGGVAYHIIITIHIYVYAYKEV